MTTIPTTAKDDMSNDHTPSDRTTVLDIEGMTCEHCVAAVNEELQNLPKVNEVSVVLQPRNVSQATLVANEPLDEHQLREAVEEAGYTLRAVHVGERP